MQITKLAISMLAVIFSISAIADDLKWDWSESDLKQSLSPVQQGKGTISNLDQSANIELFDKNNKRKYLLLCNRVEDSVRCKDDKGKDYIGHYRLYRESLGIIDLETGVIFGSFGTYVLFFDTKFLVISQNIKSLASQASGTP